MTTDRDASVRRYRQASESLDERPSAAARAAILAAAARHVEARPQAADAPRAVSRRRWPLAAAAAVLLSTLAVMMATRTEQEMPVFTAPAERQGEPASVAPTPSIAAPPSAAADDAVAPPSPPAVAPAAPPVPAPRARAQKQTAQESRADNLQTPGVERRAPDESAKGAGAGAESRLGSGAASTEAARSLPAAPAAPPAPTTAAERTAPATAGAVGTGDAAKPAASPAPERALRREAAPAAQGLPVPEMSAQEWLERIVRLRAAGRDGEADVELKRFRERYPEIQVPPAALPGGGGTR